jgi:hypothetical protein
MIASEETWLSCETEEDARIIANAPRLEFETLSGSRSGEEFAAELEETARVFEEYHMGFGARFLRRRAKEAQQNPPRTRT